MTDLVQIQQVPGGELGMLMAVNGMESVRNALTYDQQVLNSQYQNMDTYNSWYTDNLAALTNPYTEQMIMETQQLLQTSTDIRGSDWIYPITNIDGFANANDIMQRYILANPYIYMLHRRGVVDAYGHAFVDYGKNPELYYQVTSGVNVAGRPNRFEEDNSNSANYYTRTYVQGHRDLHMSEVVDILDTWDSIETILKTEGVDPTALD